MNSKSDHLCDRRRNSRRCHDQDLHNQISRYGQLLQVGLVITSEINFDVLFDLIIEQTTDIMDAERCSIFLIDCTNRYLRAFVSTDLAPNEIQIDKDHGVAGWVFSHRLPVIIDNPYEDERFCKAVDNATGYRTKCILCVPLVNRRDECIGTLQVLNKKSGRFRQEDQELLNYLASFTTIALENALLYEEIKASDAAKQKVIDHLSHELKTPLAIISGAFKRLADKFPPQDHPAVAKTVERGRRNVARLMAIQEKVDDILNRRAETGDEQRYLELVDNFSDIVEGLSEEESGLHRHLLDRISAKIKSIFESPPLVTAALRLDVILANACQQAVKAAAGRDVDIRTKFGHDLWIEMDPTVLSKTVDGILKNAVENTPDGGSIEVEAVLKEGAITAFFRDTGVGIAAEDQKNIFGGFFHTQNTELYTSKSPYQFNAGGTGSDLMRIKSFSKRFGFAVDLTSRRCAFLKTDTDQCPGRISACQHVPSRAACATSGGSVFRLKFPKSWP